MTESPRRKPGPKPRTRIAGRDLGPDLSKMGGAVSREHWYWIGALKSLPTPGIDIAGLNFPKGNESLIPDPNSPGKKARIPVPGAIVKIDEIHFRRILDRLQRSVIRFRSGPPAEESSDPRPGKRILIPTDDDLAKAAEAGRPMRKFASERFDEPLAKHVYAVLCESQDRPDRGAVVPPPVTETGLEWPEPLDD